MMRYFLKSGVLYLENLSDTLARIKSTLAGPQKMIYGRNSELLLVAGFSFLNEDKIHTGDVRNKVYQLTDSSGCTVASAFPGYAKEDDPDIAGWPLCRLPKVDHASVILDQSQYALRMHSNQHYSICNADGKDLLHVQHKGITGGWIIDDYSGLRPDLLCGMFVFCFCFFGL